MSFTNIVFPFSTADFLEEHRRVLESRLQPVIREITDSRARTREELESLYRKIVSAVLLRSGLGSPTDIAVVREATGEMLTCYNMYFCLKIKAYHNFAEIVMIAKATTITTTATFEK